MVEKIQLYLRDRAHQLQIGLGILALVFVWFGCSIPVRLSVQVIAKPLYEGQPLRQEDVQVSAKTLFGFSKDVGSYVASSVDGNRTITVQMGSLRKTIAGHPIRLKDVKASYEGSLYAGQLPHVDAVVVDGVYENGETKRLEDVWFAQKPIGNVKVMKSLPVYWHGGSTNLQEISVFPVSGIQASYTGTPIVGEPFSRNRCQVQLQYPDGTSFVTQEFLLSGRENMTYEDGKSQNDALSVPNYLSNVLDLQVLTPYGTTSLHVEPQQVDTLRVSYEEDCVYEGDRLDASKLQVALQTGKETQIEISDYRLDNPGYLHTSMTLRIPTRYGMALYPLKVQPIQDIQVDIGDEVQEGGAVQIQGVTVTYADGQTRDLSLGDITWLNLPKKWASKQTVWFQWHDKEYSVSIESVSQEILSQRGAYDGPVYDASDKVVTTLALICQRSGNDDVALDAAELALMLNRYELYGTGKKGSGDDLLSFVLESGYWGSKEAIERVIEKSKPHEMVKMMVRDTLQSGYRVLPLYVDERLNPLDFEQEFTNEDESQVSKQNQQTYWFVKEVSDTWYGYTEKAYQKQTGELPVKTEPNTDTKQETEEDVGISIVTGGE